MTSLSQLGENTVVETLLHTLPSSSSVLTGAGDDCAVVACNDEYDILLKTDCMIEGVHFDRNMSPFLVGRKALARTFSDIAAMGGSPQYALITVMVSPSRAMQELEELYRGINYLARSWDTAIVGGETSSLPWDGLVLNVALTGKVPHQQAILRNTAKPGDLIAVTGTLGDSFHSNHHLTFTPRIREATLLRQLHLANAMMDLSDGLAADLPRMARASRTGFVLNMNTIPCRRNCTIQQALTDGEDYELLFTIPPEKEPLLNIFRKLMPNVPVTLIGTMTQPTDGGKLTGGWDHFAQS